MGRLSGQVASMDCTDFVAGITQGSLFSTEAQRHRDTETQRHRDKKSLHEHALAVRFPVFRAHRVYSLRIKSTRGNRVQINWQVRDEQKKNAKHCMSSFVTNCCARTSRRLAIFWDRDRPYRCRRAAVARITPASYPRAALATVQDMRGRSLPRRSAWAGAHRRPAGRDAP